MFAAMEFLFGPLRENRQLQKLRASLHKFRKLVCGKPLVGQHGQVVNIFADQGLLFLWQRGDFLDDIILRVQNQSCFGLGAGRKHTAVHSAHIV